MRSDQDRTEVKTVMSMGREGIFFIRKLGKEITDRFWCQRKLRLRFEVTSIEERGVYRRKLFKGGTYLILLA